MWYLTLGGYTWNLLGIVLCVFSVAVIQAFLNAALNSEKPLNFPYRWLQILMRALFCEAVIATFYFAAPMNADTKNKDLIFAYIVVVFCIAVLYCAVYILAILIEQIIEWIFEK